MAKFLGGIATFLVVVSVLFLIGSSISMASLSSWVTFFVPCLVYAIPINFLTVKSLPMIIGLTRSSHTTNSCVKMVFPILNFTVVIPCIFMSLPDTFLNFDTFATFIGNFSLANMSIDMQLFSAPMSSKAFIPWSCIQMGNVVPVSLPTIILKTCLKSLQTHSTKYISGLYLHSSHLLLVSPSEALTSSVRSDSSSSGSCIFCIRLTSSSQISCPVMMENASAISLAVVLSSF